MGYNKSKAKGSNFERKAAEILNNLIKKSKFQRTPGSGMLGTILGIPSLSSDVSGKVESISQEFKIECKDGYNSSKIEGVKQFVLKKEWLDKIKMEADQSYAIPLFMGKFSGAREGVKVFVVLDVEVFANLINRITELDEENGKQQTRDLETSRTVLP